MATQAYNFIGDLNTAKDSWRLKVKVLRLWKTTYTLEMIVMDERSEKIQATVKKALFSVFEDVLEEGIIVFLNKFGVGANNGKYPMWNHQYKINFYRSTSVKRCVEFDGPTYGFEFIPFADIINHIDEPNLPVDVIGSVVECGNMELYDKGSGKEGKRMFLELEDTNGMKAKCTLWDDFALQFHEYLGSNKIQQPVVVILQFGRIRMWKGTPTFQNALFSTKLFIDVDIKEIHNFKKRYIAMVGEASTSQGGSQLSSQLVHSVREEFLNKTQRKTIDEIVDSTQPIVCVVLATIKSIDQKHGWYYVACRKHNTKVVKKSEFKTMEDIDSGDEGSVDDDGSLYCTKCKGKPTSVFPSYKVQVRVQDSTGSTSLVLFDRDVFKIVHKQAFEIREKQEIDGDGDDFTDDFDNFIDKRAIFKVEVSDYNIDIGYQVYTVLKICDDSRIITDFVEKYADDQDDDQHSNGKHGKIDESSGNCLDAKDVVSGTGDSSTILEDDDGQTASSPSVKRSREVLDKEGVADYSTTKKKDVKVKIEKP